MILASLHYVARILGKATEQEVITFLLNTSIGLGGGGTGSDVIFLTAELLSLEYHHSRNLSRNTLSGKALLTAIRQSESPPSNGGAPGD